MNKLLIGLVGALLATNQPLAISNLIQQNTGVSVTMVNPNDPAEQELQKLMAGDEAAMAEVDKWIRDNNAFAAQGAGEPREMLNRRIRARFESVRKDYEDFLRRYPDFARGHLAYGSFLNDIGEEEAAAAHYGKAAQLDPKNPAAWNNLANYYSEHGPLTNAFVDYAKAIELNPAEPVYYQNLAATVYLSRKDAMAFYGINEQQVFDKALALYRKAVQFAPDDFPLATDYAQTYYGIRPLRTNDALAAWTNALQIAHDNNERQGVYLHLARIKMAAGCFAEARAHLNDVTNATFTGLRQRLEKNLAERESAATNAKAAATPAKNETVSTNRPVAARKATVAPAKPPAVSTNAIPASTNTASGGGKRRIEPNPAERQNAATNAKPPVIQTNPVVAPIKPPAVFTNAVPARPNPPGQTGLR